MLAYFCCQNGNAIAAPTEEGLRHLGYPVQRVIPWPWTPTEFVKGTTLLVLTGMRKQQKAMRDYHVAQGIPWIAFDLPHIRGKEGDVRLYTRDHLWLPDVDGLPSRRERLGVEVAGPAEHVREAVVMPKRKGPPLKTAKGKAAAKVRAKAAREEAQAVADAEQDAAPPTEGYALVIGQVPRDSSHDMGEGQLEQWAKGVFAQIREALPGVEIVWRPHPKAGTQWDYLPVGFDVKQDSRKVSSAEAIAGARVVCVYGSTVGLEALIAGKPVVSWGPSCYQELTSWPKELATAGPASKADVDALLERIAYTQWGLDELASGEAFRFVLGQMGVACDSVA